MQEKRIANAISKVLTNNKVYFILGTLFVNTNEIKPINWKRIEDIFSEYKVKIAAIGTDAFNNLYFDLTEVN